jgi:hypothetical protein
MSRESSLYRDLARAMVSPTAGFLTAKDSFSRLIGEPLYARDCMRRNKASMIDEEML